MQIPNLGMKVIPSLHDLAMQSQSDSKLNKKIGVSSENAYTKEDAIIYQYNRQFDVNCTFDELVSGKAKISGLGLPNSEDNPDFLEAIKVFRQGLEKNGLSDEINWNSVKYDFSSTDVAMDTADLVSNKADYIASRYAVLQDRINTSYSGKELQEQMDKLDNLFADAKGLLADSYANTIGGFMDANGVEGEKENLRSSILIGIDSRVKEYADYIQNNRNYVEINSKSDKWLLQDDGYMAAQLRGKVGNSTAVERVSEEPKSAVYSLHDLEIAGMYVQETSEQYDSLEHAGVIRNEESIGLDLAVQSMKTDYLTKNSGIGNKMASLINRTFDGYMENYLKKIDDQLEKQADNSMISNGQQLYAPLDPSAVYDVFQYTMNQYQKSGDMLYSLVDGSQYGKKQYEKKVDSNTFGSMVRYQSNILRKYTWENFSQSNQDNPYALNMSDLQKYTVIINNFKQSVDSGKIQSADLMFSRNGDISSNRLSYSNISQYTQNSKLETYA